MSKNTLIEIADFLGKQKQIVVSAHVAPDADAIGSSCGLALALSQVGIDAQVYFTDSIPHTLRKLVKGVSFLTEPPTGKPTLVCVDTATEKRISGYEFGWHKSCSPIINIDHHISTEGWGDLAYIDGEAAASAAIVVELLQTMKISPQPASANLLYAGLMDDTGSFRFSNTSIKTFETAITLLQFGAKPQTVSNDLYYDVPITLMKLRALALQKISSICDGRVGFLALPLKDLEKVGASPTETEGLIDEVRSLANTEGSVFMRQLTAEDAWKISLRSKRTDWDVGAVAAIFAGGGHRAAAGCRIDGTEEQVRQKLIQAIESSLLKLKQP